MKLKEITFVLENCECITIDGKYIGDFLVEDIRTSIQRIACNAIDKMDIAYTFAIEIHKDANKLHNEFDRKPIFDRLTSRNDISIIQFKLFEDYVENGQEPIVEHYDYYVHWTGENDQENNSQKSYISNAGNLYIVVADGKGIEDFYDKETIDNEEHMDFIFFICNVGDKCSE